jgi:hypothetical protein
MSQVITIRVEVPTDIKSTALAKCEELLVKELVAIPFVEAAVVLRDTIPAHPLGWQRLAADLRTRQER